MKKSQLLSTLVLATFGVSGLASAQMPQGMDPAEMMRRFQDPEAMQRMAREAESAQKCMKDIDQAQIDALERRAKEISSEIEALCAAGKKTQALTKGLAASREMRSNATVLKLRECSKKMTAAMGDMMRDMPWQGVPGVEDDPEPTSDDICS